MKSPTRNNELYVYQMLSTKVRQKQGFRKNNFYKDI